MAKATQRRSGNKKKRAKRSGKAEGTSLPSSEASASSPSPTEGIAAAAESTSEGSAFGDKARWIRAQPIDERVSVLRARAREQGIELSENHIYAVRKTMKEAAKKNGAPKPSAPLKAPSPVNSSVRDLGVATPASAPTTQKQLVETLESTIFRLGYDASLEVFTRMKRDHYVAV